jgi:NifU-like protein involved in Fe-S cluster formation
MEPSASPTVRARTVAECVDAPAHAGPLDGAARVGEAVADGRIVRVGVWRDGPRLRARFRASACASLIAYAEVACEALEAGRRPDAAALRALVRGVHPVHLDRADLVAAAVKAALTPEPA